MSSAFRPAALIFYIISVYYITMHKIQSFSNDGSQRERGEHNNENMCALLLFLSHMLWDLNVRTIIK